LDLNLPGMDGITLAHHLREQEVCRDARIVAMTGYDDALYRLMAEEAGIDHYLVKPIDVEALEQLLRPT
jgi:CheY-like chemotaxis protein